MEYGQIHHVEYYVNDLEASNRFYSWFMPELGYSKSNEWSEGVSWSHPNGTYIVFVQVKAEFLRLGNNRQGNGLNHIAFGGGSMDQLNALQGKLELNGIKVLK